MLRWDLTLVIYLVKQRVKLYSIISVAAKLLTCRDITVQLAKINNCEQTRPFTGYPLAAANITLVSTGLITKRQLTWRWREHQNHSINVKAIETKKIQYKFGWKKLSSTDVTHNTVADSRGSFVLKHKKKIGVKAFPKTKPKEPRSQLNGLCRPRRRRRRLTCTRDVPVQRSPTMGPSAFCGISLACRPWAPRESYSSRLTRWFVRGDCGWAAAVAA